MKTVQDLISLRGRVAAVTGGAGQIGRAICATLAELGAAVVVVDRHPEASRGVADELNREYDVPTFDLPTDLTVEPDLRRICPQVVDRFDRLDILIHCAAFVGDSDLKGWSTSYDQQNADAWRQALELNLTAPFLLTQSCSDVLARSGRGVVIHIASIYGMLGPDLRLYEGTEMGNPAAYAASKGGLLQHTRWLSTVLAPRIRVNAISPGGIRRNQPESFQQQYVQRTPLQRLGAEEDLKGAVAYLASDLSSYVTGQNLVVDGGWSAW